MAVPHASEEAQRTDARPVVRVDLPAPTPSQAPPWRGRLDINTGATTHPPGRGEKLLRLLRVAVTRPVEFHDRVRAIAEVQARRRWPTDARYAAEPWEKLVADITHALHPSVSWSDDEPGFVQTCQMLQDRVAHLKDVPFPATFDGDLVLARLSYFLTLTLKPALVVESGVALGVGSSFVLSALERNGHGRLISVDLPPLGVPPEAIGAIIPDHLRTRWTLYRGSSVRVLPHVLRDQPPIGLFVHDSLFTRRNSWQEYETILPYLDRRSGAAIVANRVEVSDAFARLSATARPNVSAVVQAVTKPDLIGVNVLLE